MAQSSPYVIDNRLQNNRIIHIPSRMSIILSTDSTTMQTLLYPTSRAGSYTLMQSGILIFHSFVPQHISRIPRIYIIHA